MTEAKILSVINAAGKDRVCLTIAHRLSTIIDSDPIIVMKKAKIVEMGKHDELLKIEHGVYKSMWNQQSRIASLIEEIEENNDVIDDEIDMQMSAENEAKLLQRQNSLQTVNDKLLPLVSTRTTYNTFDELSRGKTFSSAQ